jgi:threonine synthase
MMIYTGLIEKYRDRLPVSDSTRIISLGEGNTPLIKLENIPAIIGNDVNLYIKYEGLNPTGSFKDRGMTLAVPKQLKKEPKPLFALQRETHQPRQRLMLLAQASKPL